MKRFIRRTLKHFGLEIRRIETIRTLMGFIHDRNIDVVLDVGANVGQFGASLRLRAIAARSYPMNRFLQCIGRSRSIRQRTSSGTSTISRWV